MRNAFRIFPLLIALLLLSSSVTGEVPLKKEGQEAFRSSVADDRKDEAGQGGDGEAEDEFKDDFEDEFAEEEPLIISDPFEPLNRAFFWFNDKLYFYLLKPVARGFRVVPEPARISFSNFFSNLATPIRFVNSLLQLKIKDAGNEFSRFVVNTTVGIGGLFDPGKKWAKVRKKEEDFGQTLGWYGVKPGFYIVLPLLGPSNSRDFLGQIADGFIDPLNYIFDDRELEIIALKAFEAVNEISIDKDTYEGIKRQALDPYAFIKNAHTQRREGMVKE
ncbi:MAG: VacJ family lipoprotein [Deltaproteobacteria bacterium]|nr:VacJ family lipoprotein [Deltaproteobacteria bacterium]NIS78044.1 VacJ family lipoprotein [Deltaproteobacteria bacterium]